MQNKNNLLRDGNGLAILEMYSTTEKSPELTGAVAPYTFTLTESEAHYLFAYPITELFDYRPVSAFSGSTATIDTFYIVFGLCLMWPMI